MRHLSIGARLGVLCALGAVIGACVSPAPGSNNSPGASSEPPRVRALIGAIGEEIRRRPTALKRLRASLNPVSRFEFGMLKGLSYAGRWQAKGRREP